MCFIQFVKDLASPTAAAAVITLVVEDNLSVGDDEAAKRKYFLTFSLFSSRWTKFAEDKKLQKNILSTKNSSSFSNVAPLTSVPLTSTSLLRRL